jgi:hypothetical protein
MLIKSELNCRVRFISSIAKDASGRKRNNPDEGIKKKWMC